MRFVVAFVIVLATAFTTAGCGGDHCGITTPVTGPDLAILVPPGCHDTIDEGEACDIACHYIGDHCACNAHIWTCEHPDMGPTHD
jgi:hypothetical protein